MLSITNLKDHVIPPMSRVACGKLSGNFSRIDWFQIWQTWRSERASSTRYKWRMLHSVPARAVIAFYRVLATLIRQDVGNLSHRRASAVWNSASASLRRHQSPSDNRSSFYEYRVNFNSPSGQFESKRRDTRHRRRRRRFVCLLLSDRVNRKKISRVRIR